MYLDINRKATEQRRKMFVDDATLSQLYEYTARHGLSNIDKISLAVCEFASAGLCTYTTMRRSRLVKERFKALNL